MKTIVLQKPKSPFHRLLAIIIQKDVFCTPPPNHFNYPSITNLGDNYPNMNYFILTNQGRFFYQNIYPEFPDKWRFTPSDFHRLNSDNSVHQIYKNGDLDIMLIE
jgi:hypothetical protein